MTLGIWDQILFKVPDHLLSSYQDWILLSFHDTHNLDNLDFGRQEVAGGGAGEVLEEGGESTQPRYLSRLEGLQNRIWQTGLVHPLIVQTTSKSTQSSANDLCLCKHSLNLNKCVKCEIYIFEGFKWPI